MDRQVIEMSESKVQNLIADFPWLLNMDYETIPSLKDKGMEYRLSHGKRADLILRDRRSGRPVIVEFKAVPFYRENIGQILEYRARVLGEIHDESSQLYEVFEKKLFSPILILVVPSCSEEAKLACNLSGIDIYEYESEINELVKPEKRKTLKEFVQSMKNKDIPFDIDRSDFVEGVYEEIYDVLDELLDKADLKDAWKNYNSPRGEYYEPLNNMFINKYIFEKNEIGVGIYEDIFIDAVSERLIIDFYSENENALDRFKKSYKEEQCIPFIDDELSGEESLAIKIDKKKFIADISGMLKPIIENYLKVVALMDEEVLR